MTDAARLADLLWWAAEQTEQYLPGGRVTAVVQDEAVDEVVVQQLGEFGHRLVRFLRRAAIEQQPVR